MAELTSAACSPSVFRIDSFTSYQCEAQVTLVCAAYVEIANIVEAIVGKALHVHMISCGTERRQLHEIS